MKFGCAIAILGLFGSAGIAHAADCFMQQSNFVFGMETSAQSRVKSGKICGVAFNARAGINTLKVIKPAEHGIVSIDGTHHWAYKSMPGYIGQDHYAVEFSGELMQGRQQTVMNGTATISMSVDVVP